MDPMVAIAFIVAAAAFAASLAAAIQLARGHWLALVGGRAALGEGDEASLAGVRRAGRHMAVVMGVFCALTGTIMLYEAGDLAGIDALASAGLMANNVAFVAFVIVFIWFFIMQRPDRNAARDGETRAERDAEMLQRRRQAARMDHLPVPLLLTSIALLALTALVGFAFSLI